jgi:hypothetical protein
LEHRIDAAATMEARKPWTACIGSIMTFLCGMVNALGGKISIYCRRTKKRVIFFS